jgi:predicted amino acid racemase
MAKLIIRKSTITRNIDRLNDFMETHGMQWSLIVKVLSGNRAVLTEILQHPVAKRLHSIGDSRLSNLKVVKSINPEITTMYIKPPAVTYAKSVVKLADISLNSSFTTINALNQAARELNKIHKIVIMVELGELREGIMRENIIEFYRSVFELSNIQIIGIGTNLGCMYGVEPTYDKLIQLALYKQLLEATFGRPLEIISGGSSITLPLISKKKIPPEINHMRIGEAAFFGTSPLTGKRFRRLSTEAFEFQANIIELERKDYQPDGQISDASIGTTQDLQQPADLATSYRAILDFGVLDANVDHLTPKNKAVSFFGTTSDMTVYDLGDSRHKYRVGSKISFHPDYMAVARLMNSKFIAKEIRE